MNLIKTDIIMECIGDNTQSIFTEINRKCDSYWEEKEDKYPCVLEYMFDTPIAMMELLKIYIENDKLRRLVTADSFKMRSEKLKIQTSKKNKDIDDVKLPEYVYVF